MPRVLTVEVISLPVAGPRIEGRQCFALERGLVRMLLPDGPSVSEAVLTR